jgi:hypothetical protein
MPLFIVIILVALFYSVGNFGLLNIFGVRLELQALLIGLLTIITPYIFFSIVHKWKKCKSEPILWLAIIILATSFPKPSNIILLNYGTFLVVIGFYSLNDTWKEKVLRYIVYCSSIFALFVFVQAFFVMFDFDLGFLLRSGYSSDSKDTILNIAHPLGYLGFTMHPVFVFNTGFWRFISYSTEGSVLIYLFVAPGFLALTLRGAIKWCAVLLIGFPVLLSFSSTTYIIFFTSILFWTLSRKLIKKELNKKKIYFLLSLPIIIAIFFVLFIASVGVENGVSQVNQITSSIGGESQSTIFEKSVSATERIAGFKTILDNLNFYPFGSNVVLDAPMSLPISNYFEAGLGAFIFSFWLLLKIAKLSISNLYSKSSLTVFAASGVIPIIIIILTYSDYGWRIPPGYLMLAMMKWGLERVTNLSRSHG